MSERLQFLRLLRKARQEDRRKHPRYRVNLPAGIYSDDKALFLQHCTLLISLRGALDSLSKTHRTFQMNLSSLCRLGCLDRVTLCGEAVLRRALNFGPERDKAPDPTRLGRLYGSATRTS
jgi:hypothetical protein